MDIFSILTMIGGLALFFCTECMLWVRDYPRLPAEEWNVF